MTMRLSATGNCREKSEYICNNPFKRWPELQSYEWMGWNSF
jgi:hypothetical protein